MWKIGAALGSIAIIILVNIALWQLYQIEEHVPEVGKEISTSAVCNAEASHTIFIVMESRGAGIGAGLAAQYGRRGMCRPLGPALTRAAKVSSVTTPDGETVYMVQLQFEAPVWGEPWYTFHWHDAEGSE